MNKSGFRKLNIVFLDFDDIKNPLLGAGQAKATLEMGRRLVEKGHKIEVICSKYPGSKDRVEHGIKYKHIGLGTKNIRLNNFGYILILPFYVRSVRADIVIECFTAPISTLFSPLFTKIPVLATSTSFEAERFSKLYHLPFGRVEKFGLRFYKYFAPLNNDHDNKMKKTNPNAVSKIITDGVGDEFFKVKLTKPEYILFLGRLDIGQKGIDLLLKAYAKVKDKIKYPLVIAGNGPDEAKVKKLIEELNIGDRVKMVGPTFGDKKMELLSKAAYVAFPSRHEGFSLFALEATASGLPIVSFDIPGLSWTDKRTNFKAKPFDIGAFSRLLEKVATNGFVDASRGKYRQFAKQYTWNKITNDFENFLNQILIMEARGNA